MIDGVSPQDPTLVQLALCRKDTLQRPKRGQIDAFVEEDRVDLADGEIEEAFLVELLQDLGAFLRRERPGRSWTRTAKRELSLTIERSTRQVQSCTSATPANGSGEALQVRDQDTTFFGIIGPSMSKSATFF